MQLSLIPVGALARSHDDRALVVGEAAGQVKTTSNDGIYYSMFGAREAAAARGVSSKLSRIHTLCAARHAAPARFVMHRTRTPSQYSFASRRRCPAMRATGAPPNWLPRSVPSSQ